MSKTIRWTSCVSIAALGILWTPLAAAQLAPGSTAVQNSAKSEDEIIVTAQRRAEALEDVPISITSIPADTLKNSGVEGLLELSRVTPGLVTNRFGTALQPAIRGVTTRVGENSVATYVDGFYIPNPASIDSDFNNIERVDVLKGPQGTLFGRNATGGAIVITTRDPSPDFRAEASGAIEELHGWAASAYLTGGLAEGLTADVAVTLRRSGGYIEDIRAGDTINDSRRYNGRVRLMWKPSDSVKIIATGEHGLVDDPTTAAFATYYSHRLLPVIVPAPIGRTGFEDNVVAVNGSPGNKTYYDAGYLKGEFDFGGVKLTSLTSYRRDINKLRDGDIDGSATANFINFVWDTEERTFQQEFNLASDNGGGLTWVVGAYYFNDWVQRDELPGNIQVAPTTNRGVIKTDAWAGFADVSYSVSDALTLTGGLRYTSERKEASFRAPFLGTPLIDRTSERKFTDLSPRAVVRYAINGSTNIYASYTQGFKSGVFNNSAGLTRSTEPEDITAYEVGFKTRAGPISFDTAAFYYDWKNIQVARVDPTAAGASTIQNAAAAEIYGGEFQTRWAAADNFNLRLGVAYTHGRYTDFNNASVNVSAQPNNPAFPNSGTSTQDWSGNQLIRSPDWSGNFSWDYTAPLPMGALIFAGNVYYTSKFLPNTARENPLTGKPDLTSGPYALVGLTLTWKATDHLSLALYGRNITNARYVIGRDSNAFGEFRIYGEPRVLGVRLGLTY